MGWNQPEPLAFVANQSRHDRSQAALLMLGEQAELLPRFPAEAQGFDVVGSVYFFLCVFCHGHYYNMCVSPMSSTKIDLRHAPHRHGPTQ